MPTIIDKKIQQHGMALGGIGTGTVEINQNGTLTDWHIFNLGKWASADPKRQMQNLYDYEKNVMPFYIRTKQGNDLPKVRKLSHDVDGGEFRSMMYSWHKEVSEIHYDPSFPVCKLKYIDDSLPVNICSEFTSPFVPLDSRISGTPGFFASFFVENISNQDVEVSLLGKLKNPVNRGLMNRQLRNILQKDGDRIVLHMKSDSLEPHPQNGSICFSVSGENTRTSFIQSDFSLFFANYVLYTDFGTTEESYLFDFRDKGVLPDLGVETLPQWILNLSAEEIELLGDREVDSVMEQLLKIASVNRPFRRITEIDGDIFSCRKGKIAFILSVIKKMKSLAIDEKGQEAWGDAALCSSFVLSPGERKKVQFIVSWYFPHHISDAGRFVGHMYSNWFKDAREVNDFMYAHSQEILSKVGAFSSVLGHTDVDASFVNSWRNQLNTLLKCSWWSKEGDFALWEGYGSCGFHTTDITYQGSFGILALFPDLQLRQMKMGARFQREDGRVHHFFTPDFYSVDNGFDRVDMNPQFVLLVCRDYLWTGNKDYLKKMWSHVVKAMESIEKLDGNNDGLPDRETKRNTYDAWSFRGTSSYISSLWLAAVLAASRMAEDLGEQHLKQKWQAILEKGKESFKAKLWNNEYFSLWVDEEARDECCMTDQIDGQWYAQLLGLGNFIPEELLLGALRAVIKYNYHPETGLINAAYPKHTKPTLHTYRNVQAESNWSGIEFAFASALLENGMVKEATEITRNVDRRYFKAGRIFNHEECGNYYYRAMSSWSLLLSITGFRLDVPRGILEFIPPVESITGPWFSPSGFGYYRKNQKEFVLVCTYGSISFSKLIINIEKDVGQVFAGDRAVSFKVEEEPKCTIIDFGKKIEITPDTVLRII